MSGLVVSAEGPNMGDWAQHGALQCRHTNDWHGFKDQCVASFCQPRPELATGPLSLHSGGLSRQCGALPADAMEGRAVTRTPGPSPVSGLHVV